MADALLSYNFYQKLHYANRLLRLLYHSEELIVNFTVSVPKDPLLQDLKCFAVVYLLQNIEYLN
jgi:hypothetical protein